MKVKVAPKFNSVFEELVISPNEAPEKEKFIEFCKRLGFIGRFKQSEYQLTIDVARVAAAMRVTKRLVHSMHAGDRDVSLRNWQLFLLNVGVAEPEFKLEESLSPILAVGKWDCEQGGGDFDEGRPNRDKSELGNAV